MGCLGVGAVCVCVCVDRETIVQHDVVDGVQFFVFLEPLRGIFSSVFYTVYRV